MDAPRPRTIRRRILEYDLEDLVRFSDISDQHLDELFTQFVNAFPCAGQTEDSCRLLTI